MKIKTLRKRMISYYDQLVKEVYKNSEYYKSLIKKEYPECTNISVYPPSVMSGCMSAHCKLDGKFLHFIWDWDNEKWVRS